MAIEYHTPTNRGFKGLAGQRFGRLTALGVVAQKIGGATNGRPRNRYYIYECKCDCGGLRSVSSAVLKSGKCKSCGCIQEKHGKSDWPEYQNWTEMKARCYRPSKHAYERYGGRGIKVCDRWKNSFAAFIEDMGRKPTSTHSIDRIDNDGDYEPDNCKWSTPKEQCNNKRNNRLIEFNGLSMTLTEWANHIGISAHLLYDRLDKLGWSVERAMTVGAGDKPGPKPGSSWTQKDSVRIEYNGETLTFHQWEKRTGINSTTIRDRIYKQGWSVDKALTEPVRSKKLNTD